MFYFKKPAEDAGLEKAIDQVLVEMSEETNTFTEDYQIMVDQLVKLYALKEDNSKRRISPDTLATVVANVIGIVLIVGHERAHVVTSKALNFIRKLD